MRAVKCLTCFATSLALLLLVLIGSAAAGGSWIYPLQDRYDPGEQATMQGSFGSGQLGWLQDGPFYGYLRVDPLAVQAAEPDSFPYVHQSDVPLGELQIEPGGSWGLVATLDFIVPDVEPGLYDVVYCNDPCTDGIGDLIGGTISIGQDPPRPLTEESIASQSEPSLAIGETEPPERVARSDARNSLTATTVRSSATANDGHDPGAVVHDESRGSLPAYTGLGVISAAAAGLALLALRRARRSLRKTPDDPKEDRSQAGRTDKVLEVLP